MGIIQSIRLVDPQRLLFFESTNLDDGTLYHPSIYMKYAGVVQTLKFGVGEFFLSRFTGQDTLFESGYVSIAWPSTKYYASPWLHGSAGKNNKDKPQVIDGFLKKDTVVDIYLDEVNKSGTLVVSDDSW